MGRAFPALPSGGGRAHPQHFALDLALADDDAADFRKMKRGLLIAALVGTLQADEAGERGSVAAFEPEGFVGGMMAAFLARVVIVGAPQGGRTENTLDMKCVAALADFPGLGLVGGVDLVGGFLEELADDLGSRCENGGAQQFLKVRDEGAAGPGGAKGGNQPLDFLLPGEAEGFVVWRFFLTPALRS